ncbi:MAG: DUF448 domain-containing protein [Sphingomonadales bacterium]|nr:DUF448 domain-containing protein [Sphingomonadales bacterium]
MRESLMRNPHNETGETPERRCIITGERGSRGSLIRLALGPDDVVLPDVRAKAPGRGAWIGVPRAELEAAIAMGKLKGALARAFKASVEYPDDLAQRIEDALARNAMDRLGLESRGGTLLTGSDRIEEAARRGRVALLLHASDARDDGCRKLAQAWRVGQDLEGSGLAGVRLSADRHVLALALGRENCVHIAITDRRAAHRIDESVGRWQRFIGLEWVPALAESAAKVHGDAAHGFLQEDGLGQ